MLNPLKCLWRRYTKRPPKAINPSKNQKAKSPSFASPEDPSKASNPGTPEDTSNKEPEADFSSISPLSLKFQDFIKSQQIEEFSEETKEKLKNSQCLNQISKNIFSGQVIDLEGIDQELSKDLEEFQKGMDGEEDAELNELMQKIAEEIKNDLDAKDSVDGKGPVDEDSSGFSDLEERKD